MRVCVLGHRGMLGHVLARFLAGQGTDIVTTDARFAAEDAKAFVAAACASRPDWVVNCASIPPHALEAGIPSARMIAVNEALPQALAALLPDGIRLLQPSTDGVFRADLPERRVEDRPDAADAYGRSKAAAEGHALLRPGTVVLRCSIVGLESATRRYLLSWFLAQRGTVDGYANQMWNGVTALEWSRQAASLMQGAPADRCTIHQPGTWPPLSKAALLETIARVWKHPVEVRAIDAPRAVRRTLRPSLLNSAIDEQLKELHDWYAPVRR
ncbi:MAG: NAD-dependent epimerase/dehydratase family protein [Betaproteobacteria bacterium]|nr:NAD-dependent epimerase/dehydratase family protein [Betaproteobacteria bacterium]